MRTNYKLFIWVLAAAGLRSSTALAQCGGLSVGTNIDVSTRTANESEGAICINPANPNQMFYLSNVDTGNLLRCAYSTNGGSTWTKRDFATGSDGLSAACCDGSAAFDSFGNLFVCYINATVNSAIVGLSTNGGQSFTQLPTLSSVNDQPTLTTGPGSVWVTYFTPGQTIAARGAAVTGLGTVGAFSAAQIAPTSSNCSFGDIAVGPTGKVMVTYQDNTGGQGASHIYVNTDPDGSGAAGFGARVTVTATNVGGFDFIPAQNSRSVDAEAGLAWDRSGGAHNGRVYLVYTDETPDESNNMDIYVRFSDNDGSTWSAAVKVNDDTTTNSQFLPKIALDQTTGNIAVMWYDCRNDNGTVGGGFTDTIINNEAQIYASASIDGGLTFLPNIRVSTGTSKASSANNGIDFGDYTGIAFHNGVFFPLWADNSGVPSGNPNLPKLDEVTAAVTLTSAPPPAPSNPQATPSTICAGASSVLSATVSGGQTVDWFTGSCGGSLVSGGSTPTVTPAVTTTYFARTRVTANGCASTSCATVTVTVNALPAAPTSPQATPSTICAGSSSVLSATVGGGETVDWYTGSCGGTLVSGGSTPTVAPAATTTYFARARNTTTGCNSTACASATVTVNPLPAAPTNPQAAPSTICAGASAVLSASVPGGQTVDWYTGSCGGTPVSGGSSPTVSPAATTTYFARARNTTTGCTSAACANVTVTVNSLPATPQNATATPNRICAGQTASLSATVNAGETVDWFTQSCGQALVPGGQNPTVMPSGTTTYFARARNTTTGCVSSNCATTIVVDASHTGDFDGGGVGASDLPAFVAILLAPGTPQDCIADMNADGSVDGQDIQLFVNALIP